MPATITYLSVAPSTAVPVRVFVHRKKILLLSSVAVNEKSIIKLSSINLIRLSNYDLTNLFIDIELQLKALLLATPLSELFLGRSLLRSTKLVKDIDSAWRCKVVVSLGYLVDLRYRLSSLYSAADAQFLADRGIDVDLSSHGPSRLLRKSLKFNFTPRIAEDELTVDEKKHVSYLLREERLINCKATDSLDIYVLHRPRQG